MEDITNLKPRARAKPITYVPYNSFSQENAFSSPRCHQSRLSAESHSASETPFLARRSLIVSQRSCAVMHPRLMKSLIRSV